MKYLEMAQKFTTDLVRRAIKSCRNSNDFPPDKLSIFHLKQLGPTAIEYIIALFNLFVTTCQIPAIWKSSLIIPIPKTWQGHLHRNFVSAYLASPPSPESTGVSESQKGGSPWTLFKYINRQNNHERGSSYMDILVSRTLSISCQAGPGI